MGTLLDREVDVADRYLVFNLVVEDRLEGAYDLYQGAWVSRHR